MEINLKKDNKELFKAVEFVKKWTPNPDNSEKNPAADALWLRGKVFDFLKQIKQEGIAVKQLLDCDIRIPNTVKGLPSIDKMYKLLKADYQKKCDHYGKFIRKYDAVADIWNGINQIDAHLFAATKEDPTSDKKFESGIEKDTWKRVGKFDQKFWDKLDSHSKYNDYHNYGAQCAVKHPEYDTKNPEIKLGKIFTHYKVLAYLGRNVTQRPLFSVLKIFNTTGNFFDDMKKLPKDWKPIYVCIPTAKPDTRVEKEG
jgi:hypothetical protein